jgi:hypothetical protein
MTEDLMAWLGPAAAGMTPDQIGTVREIARLIDARWPDQDDAPSREAALSGAVQIILGDTTAADLARDLAAARLAETAACAAALGGAAALARTGTAKATAARTAGVDRMSLLKILGER